MALSHWKTNRSSIKTSYRISHSVIITTGHPFNDCIQSPSRILSAVHGIFRVDADGDAVLARGENHPNARWHVRDVANRQRVLSSKGPKSSSFQESVMSTLRFDGHHARIPKNNTLGGTLGGCVVDPKTWGLTSYSLGLASDRA